MAKAGPHAAMRMTALSLALSAGTAGGATLCDLPTEVLCEMIDEAAATEPSNPQKAHVLGLLQADTRPAVRAQVAQAMGSLWPEPGPTAAAELRRLSRDESDSVRISAAAGLARAIERSSAPERIDLVCSWALSADPDERLALARALTWATPVFVADLVLQQLAQDEAPAVRGAALAAAARHFHENSAAYTDIVSQCENDSDANVKRIARAMLKRARG